jgi:hypothetical protein
MNHLVLVNKIQYRQHIEQKFANLVFVESAFVLEFLFQVLPIDELLHQELLPVLLAIGIQFRDLGVLAQIFELHGFRLKQGRRFGLTGAKVRKLLDHAAGFGGLGFVSGEVGDPKPALSQQLQGAVALEQVQGPAALHAELATRRIDVPALGVQTNRHGGGV